MSVLPPEELRTMRNAADGVPAEAGNEPVGSLAQRWADLHQTAAQLAGVAGLSPEPTSGEHNTFAARLANANAWQCEMASQGIEDIDAMMRPGLAALGTLAERGQDASIPAQALWREFHHAREAVLAIVEPRNS